jgi:Domain of unknown function (DUF5063)
MPSSVDEPAARGGAAHVRIRVVDPGLEGFRRAAEEYRRTVVEAETTPDLARRLRNAIARVYLAATGLPSARSAVAEVRVQVDEPREPLELERRVAAGLRRDACLVAWGPTQHEPIDPIVGSLSLELGEIYDDLGRALAQIERGTGDDLSGVRVGFEERWGGRAVNTLRPLHQLATGR